MKTIATSSTTGKTAVNHAKIPLWKFSLALSRHKLTTIKPDPAVTEGLTYRIMYNGLLHNQLSTRA